MQVRHQRQKELAALYRAQVKEFKELSGIFAQQCPNMGDAVKNVTGISPFSDDSVAIRVHRALFLPHFSDTQFVSELLGVLPDAGSNVVLQTVVVSELLSLPQVHERLLQKDEFINTITVWLHLSINNKRTELALLLIRLFQLLPMTFEHITHVVQKGDGKSKKEVTPARLLGQINSGKVPDKIKMAVTPLMTKWRELVKARKELESKRPAAQAQPGAVGGKRKAAEPGRGVGAMQPAVKIVPLPAEQQPEEPEEDDPWVIRLVGKANGGWRRTAPLAPLQEGYDPCGIFLDRPVNVREAGKQSRKSILKAPGNRATDNEHAEGGHRRRLMFADEVAEQTQHLELVRVYVPRESEPHHMTKKWFIGGAGRSVRDARAMDHIDVSHMLTRWPAGGPSRLEIPESCIRGTGVDTSGQSNREMLTEPRKQPCDILYLPPSEQPPSDDCLVIPTKAAVAAPEPQIAPAPIPMDPVSLYPTHNAGTNMYMPAGGMVGLYGAPAPVGMGGMYGAHHAPAPDKQRVGRLPQGQTACRYWNPARRSGCREGNQCSFYHAEM